MDFACAADGLGRDLTQTEVLDLPGLFQLDHRLDGGLDGLFRLNAVAVVEVDLVDAEAGEGFVACFADVGGLVADGSGAVRGGVVSEFGGEEDLGTFAPGLEPSSCTHGLGQQELRLDSRPLQDEEIAAAAKSDAS